MSLCVNSLRMIAKRSISMRYVKVLNFYTYLKLLKAKCIYKYKFSASLASGSGSGVGKGGGSGGAIRDAGGKFGEMEAAQENAYFRKLVAIIVWFLNRFLVCG